MKALPLSIPTFLKRVSPPCVGGLLSSVDHRRLKARPVSPETSMRLFWRHEYVRQGRSNQLADLIGPMLATDLTLAERDRDCFPAAFQWGGSR